jgi:Mn2+/Fe2+ NRAMP family transporter
VLAGSVSYILAETFDWKEGLNKKWHEAPGFYIVMALALLLGLLFDFLGISTMQALLLAAVLYGLTAPVLLALLLHIGNNQTVMGRFVNKRRSNVWGGITLALMSTAAVLLLYFW